MRELNNITVFCGAGAGRKEIYVESAYNLGKFLAEENIGLVYGGGATGMMGAVAEGTLDAGGHVIGVIPQFLVDREVAHERVQDMQIVRTMHERKALLEEQGDGIIMMPGGAGTLEEFFEVFTWAQLGLHDKPIGILNVNGFFDGLIEVIRNLIRDGFLEERYEALIMVETDASELLKKFKEFTPLPTRTYEDIQKLN